MRNWTEHGFSRLTAISDAGSTPAASTNFFRTALGTFAAWRILSSVYVVREDQG